MIANQQLAPPPLPKHAAALGVACGAGAALCWALGFVAAQQHSRSACHPLVLALHRYVWPGLALLPFVATNSFRDLGGIGWGRGFTLALFGGLPLALLSYIGYLFVPLGHGGVIQPSCAALGGMLLAWLVLKEPLPGRRIAGALAMVLGLCIIGIEALRTIGAHGVGGDLLFAAAGGFSPRSACWCGCGGFRRCGRRPSPAFCRLSNSRCCCSNSTTCWPRDFLNLLQAVIQGGTARRRCHLPLHASGRAARRLARGFVSRAGSAVHAVGRISDARRSAEHCAACWTGRRRRRLPADAKGLRRKPAIFLVIPDCREAASPKMHIHEWWLWIPGSSLRSAPEGQLRCLAARQKLTDAVKRAQNIFPSSWRRTPAHSLRRARRNPGRRSARRRKSSSSADASGFAFQPVRLILGKA